MMKLPVLASSDSFRFTLIESVFHFEQRMFRQMPGRRGKERIVLISDMKIQQCDGIIGKPFKSNRKTGLQA